jgi:hypothetical protein
MRDTAMLRQAFREAMSRAGQPMKRMYRVVRSNRRMTQIYRTPSGQTVHLRTNRRRALMTVAEGFAPEDVMECEGQQDFIGIAIPGLVGSVECFLVPTDEAIERLRCAHRSWLAQHPGSASDVRAIRFDGDPQLAWEGFSEKWAQFRLRAATSPASMRPSLEQIIADYRRAIAAQVGRPDSAVRISIEY